MADDHNNNSPGMPGGPPASSPWQVPKEQTAGDFNKMVADYMEAGYLENIADLIRSDKSALRLIPILAADHRAKVRIGAAALVESLMEEMKPELRAMASLFQQTIENPEPTIQADAVYILSLIGGPDALKMLRFASGSAHPLVRKSALEAIEEIIA